MYKILSFSLNRLNENADNLPKNKIPLYILLQHQFQFNKIHILSFSDFIENQPGKHGVIFILNYIIYVWIILTALLCLGEFPEIPQSDTGVNVSTGVKNIIKCLLDYSYCG